MTLMKTMIIRGPDPPPSFRANGPPYWRTSPSFAKVKKVSNASFYQTSSFANISIITCQFGLLLNIFSSVMIAANCGQYPQFQRFNNKQNSLAVMPWPWWNSLRSPDCRWFYGRKGGNSGKEDRKGKSGKGRRWEGKDPTKFRNKSTPMPRPSW